MRRTTVLAVVIAAFVAALLPALASEPASHDVTVPAAPGQTVEVTWTGVIAPGVETSSDCSSNPTADPHAIELAVAPGVYNAVRASMSATITATGGTASATDVIVTLVDPDGTAISGDAGFVGVAETATVSNPAAGTWQVLACAFAGAVPQPYEGTLVIETEAAADDALVAAGLPCVAPPSSPKFEMGYIDESRAGGEPMITRHPDGQLLWGSHAGTTHFYTPTVADDTTAAFVENYEGQTYQYVSDDGESWEFVPRTVVAGSEPVDGLPATGFSDPEFAIEQDGTVYISEINLANVAVYKSEDGGHSYQLVNVFAFTQSDRQWMAADRDGELYMAANGFGGGSFPSSPVGQIGHFIAKSTDGGFTWGAASTTNPGGVADIQIDHARGILYELTEEGGTLSMARFPNIREEDTEFTVEHFEIVSQLGLSGVQRLIDPTFDLDDEGNLYVTWSDNGSGARPEGIYYAASTDQGETWSTPVRVDPNARDDVWPWITVGEPGHVAITWLQSDQATDAILGGEAGGTDARWHVMVAQTGTALGCGSADAAGFRVTQASDEPVHTGTICQHGTTCQTDLTDRRLGDYFSIENDADRMMHIAVSDTRQGGAVALPLHIRQVDGRALKSPGRSAARLRGPTRFATAAAISQHQFPNGASTVYLARATDPLVDSVAGGTLSDGPILLVPSCGEVPAEVLAEIDRLDPERVVALGGVRAICDDVLTAASTGRDADRLQGPTRFDTAIVISQQEFPDGADRVYLARAFDPLVDAVAGGSLTDGPILLVPACAEVPADVLAEIDRVDPDRVIALGGSAAICDDVLEVASGRREALRLEGSTRFETAAAIAQHQFPDGASSVYLARAFDPLVDAVAGGSLKDGPILLVPPCGDVPADVRAEIDRVDPGQVVALGGPAAICADILTQASN